VPNKELHAKIAKDRSKIPKNAKRALAAPGSVFVGCFTDKEARAFTDRSKEREDGVLCMPSQSPTEEQVLDVLARCRMEAQKGGFHLFGLQYPNNTRCNDEKGKEEGGPECWLSWLRSVLAPKCWLLWRIEEF
jgi:hypothetical protein